MLHQREKIGLKGNMHMGAGVDLKTTKKEAKKLKRKHSKPSKENETSGDWPNSSQFFDALEMEEPMLSTTDDTDYIPSKKTTKSHDQNRVDLTIFAAEAIRYGISPRAASALHNACLISDGLITDEDKSLLADKNKIIRAMDSYKKTQKSHQKSRFAEKGQLQCIGVDGKKDKKTLQKETQIIDGEEVEKFVINHKNTTHIRACW